MLAGAYKLAPGPDSTVNFASRTAVPYRSGSMKVKIDIDCTPEEARTFFGLPDLGPLQQEMLKAMQERMMSAMGAMDPEAIMKAWMPGGAFWGGAGEPWKK
jgi:Family of unknown function (DUF6489)